MGKIGYKIVLSQVVVQCAEKTMSRLSVQILMDMAFAGKQLRSDNVLVQICKQQYIWGNKRLAKHHLHFVQYQY